MAFKSYFRSVSFSVVGMILGFCLFIATSHANQGETRHSTPPVWGNWSQLSRSYDQFFPLYVKSCSLTRMLIKGGETGAPWGHGVIYVKGMCRDKSVPYPKVKVCGPEVDLKDRESGTLVSADRWFKSTNWVATEGYKLAFHGGLSEEDELSYLNYYKSIQNLLDTGQFQGVKYYRRWAQRVYPGLKHEESIVSQGLGTDYAIDFGRAAYCEVVPINEKQLEEMVNHLNHLNRPYVEGGKSYSWNPFNNNCMHLVINTLAAGGLVSEQPIQRLFPLGFFDVLIPARELLKVLKIKKGFDHLHWKKIYRDKKKRENFIYFKRPPLTHGSLVRFLPMRAKDNRYFTYDEKMSAGIIYSGKDTLAELTNIREFKDLAANLRFFQKHYIKIKEEIPDWDELARVKPKYATVEFKNFRVIYEKWLDDSLEEVRNMLASPGLNRF